jgi:hypothetical protein
MTFTLNLFCNFVFLICFLKNELLSLFEFIKENIFL